MTVLVPGLRLNNKNKEYFFKELEQKSFSVNWPYLAGMIDGDGCVRNVDTILGLVDKEPVEYLSKLFTSSLMIKLDSKKNRTAYVCQPRYFVSVSGEKNLYLLKKIYPYTVEKREQIAKVIEQYEPVPSGHYLEHTKEEFFQWFAGFAEAEGSFTFTEKQRRFSIGTTNYMVIDYVFRKLKQYDIVFNKLKPLQTVKASVRYEPQKKYNITRKEHYSFTLSGIDLVALCKKILPYMMMQRKISSLKKILEHYNKTPPIKKNFVLKNRNNIHYV